jgi:hypothetical protein
MNMNRRLSRLEQALASVNRATSESDAERRAAETKPVTDEALADAIERFLAACDALQAKWPTERFGRPAPEFDQDGDWLPSYSGVAVFCAPTFLRAYADLTELGFLPSRDPGPGWERRRADLLDLRGVTDLSRPNGA